MNTTYSTNSLITNHITYPFGHFTCLNFYSITISLITNLITNSYVHIINLIIYSNPSQTISQSYNLYSFANPESTTDSNSHTSWTTFP